jgi:hypothetical protein
MQNEEEKKREGQKNPEDFLQKIWNEMNNLKDDIVENTINITIHNEKSELDNLQNSIVWNREQSDWSVIEKGEVLGAAQKKLASMQKEISASYKPSEYTEEVVPPEVIRVNQTRSRLNVEQKLVPMAWMPRRLVNKLDASN